MINRNILRRQKQGFIINATTVEKLFPLESIIMEKLYVISFYTIYMQKVFASIVMKSMEKKHY